MLKNLKLAGAASLLVGAIALGISADMARGALSTADEKEIQTVVLRSYEIEAAAAHDFDTTAFPSVFVNDLRGGELSKSTISFVESVGTELKGDFVGYLDYKLAYFAQWQSGAEKYEQVQATADKEGRPLTEAEAQSLIDDSGRIAAPRAAEPTAKPVLKFISVTIKDDIAIVVFDDGPRTNEMRLVRIKDQWLIAGNTILSVHP